MEQTNNSRPIQWFPGHMTKTRRQMEKDLALVDGVVEIVDARVPQSSRNPDLPGIVGGKPLFILLNKCDLADETVTAGWIRYFEARQITALPVDGKTGKGLNRFRNAVQATLADVLERNRQRGMDGKAVRLMVAGIPNVGKSTLINRLCGANKALAQNRPGVTRGNQWYTVDKQLELLDTPGILWPKFDREIIGYHLGFTGAIKDTVLDPEDLAVRLLDSLTVAYPALLDARYGLERGDGGYDLLIKLAQSKGMRQRGNQPDTARAAAFLLEEFRNGKIGCISLERAD